LIYEIIDYYCYQKYIHIYKFYRVFSASYPLNNICTNLIDTVYCTGSNKDNNNNKKRSNSQCNRRIWRETGKQRHQKDVIKVCVCEWVNVWVSVWVHGNELQQAEEEATASTSTTEKYATEMHSSMRCSCKRER